MTYTVSFLQPARAAIIGQIVFQPRVQVCLVVIEQSVAEVVSTLKLKITIGYSSSLQAWNVDAHMFERNALVHIAMDQE